MARFVGAAAGNRMRRWRVLVDAVQSSQCGSANLLDGTAIQSLDNRPKNHSRAAGLWSLCMWVLLLLPFIGLLWVPFYNFQEPALFGFPFFYWYQLAWVPLSSLLIWLVYRRRTPDETP
jgi:hypothetical protein